MNWLLAALLTCPAYAAGHALWTQWYLVTQAGKPVSLYEETAEKRAKEEEIAITQKWVEKVSGRDEIYIGSVSEAGSLAPVAFFVERKGAKSYKIDGRAKGKRLEVTFKPGSPDLAKSTEYTPLGAGSYLSGALPLAIARHFKTKGADSLSFTAIVEDAGEMNVEVKGGKVDIGTAEKKFGKDLCRNAVVTLDGKVQEWWISHEGKTCLVSFPDSGTRLELSTESAAKKALKEKP